MRVRHASIQAGQAQAVTSGTTGSKECQRPLVFRTHFLLAEELVHHAVAHNADEFVVHRLEFDGVSLSTVTIRGVSSTQNISHKVAQQAQIGQTDELMQRLHDSLTPRKRCKGKTPDIEDSSTGSETEHSSIEDSDMDVVDVATDDPPLPPQPAALAPAPPAGKASSFFFTEAQLGLVEPHISHSGRAECHICNLTIKKGELRGSWAWSCTKPHRYIHGSAFRGLMGSAHAERSL